MMNKNITPSLVLIGIAAGTCMWFGHVVHAQAPGLDKGALIDTLGREGMGELLAHMARTEGGQDPVAAKLIEIAQYRVKYHDANLGREKQLAALDQMIQAMRSLIEDHHDHEQRPIWQTDLASLLLYEYLQVVHQRAAEFYEFGVPTVEQRETFESTVADAYAHLADADLRFYHLNNNLPREPDHEQKRVQTGLWGRMIDEYYKTKTQFLLGKAAYYTSLLSNEHPYFKDLNNPNIPRQKTDADEEHQRLLQLTIERLQPLLDAGRDRYRLRTESRTLIGRAMTRLPLHEIDPAIDLFDAATKDQSDGAVYVVSQLSKAVALEKKSLSNDADQLLTNLADDPITKSNLLLRLLVTDQTHRLALTRAQAGPEAARPTGISQAYKVYETLLSDPSLGEGAEGLKNYVYARWETLIDPEADQSDLPDAVLAAAGEMARLGGQALVYESEQLSQADQDDRAAELIAQAKPKLQRAVSINTSLLGRENLSPRMRANAMFNVAMSNYLLAEGDAELLIGAANLWTDLAQDMPDQPIADEAVTLAITVLRQLYSLDQKPPNTAEAYERTAELLFNQFSTSDAADNERVYYAFYHLAPQGRYAEAAKVLEKLPKGHPQYFEAQRERMISLKKVFDDAQDNQEKEATAHQVIKSARLVIDEARSLPFGADAQQVQTAREAHGWARLILADLAISRGNTDEALRQLDGFDEQFKQEPDLVREALAKGIVALAQTGKYEQLVFNAKKMMEMFPNDAAAVIDGVLTDLTGRIERLRRESQTVKIERKKIEMTQQATAFGEAARMLAELLLDWAVRQKMSDEDLLPFKLLLAKAMRMAGKAQGALDILEPLLAQSTDDIDLIHNTAETLFAVGDQPSLIEAASMYDRLISGLSPPYPPMWWNAWMRRLQVMDRLNQSASDIPLRVRALGFTDPNLGGEPYRSEFKRLELKHSQ